MLKLCGEYLGEGFRRVVYRHKEDDSLVIKFLKNPDDDYNQIEFDNWQRLKDTDKGKWLVPCVAISDDSRFLFQRKVEVVEEIPDNIPDWIKVLGDYTFGGNKSKHWGKLDGRLVLIDYGDKPL